MLENEYICKDCVNDDGLKEYIEETGISGKCNLCNTDKKSIQIKELLDYIKTCIESECASPEQLKANNVDLPSIPLIKTEDLVGDILKKENTDLRKEVIKKLKYDAFYFTGRMFLKNNKYVRLWEKFKEETINKRRFTHLLEDCKSGSELSMDKICEILNSYKMIIPIEKDCRFYRGRGKKWGEQAVDVVFDNVSDICPPPLEKTTEGRMNPKGISMFYCADSLEIVRNELEIYDMKTITIAIFKNLKKMLILDLTRIRAISLFSKDRKYIQFLVAFSEDISKPKNINNNLQLEYIPTQVVTEYFKYYLNISGIKYKSAVNKSGNNYVFFCNRENFKGVDGAKDLWFEMQGTPELFKKKMIWDKI